MELTAKKQYSAAGEHAAAAATACACLPAAAAAALAAPGDAAAFAEGRSSPALVSSSAWQLATQDSANTRSATETAAAAGRIVLGRLGRG